MYFGVFGGVSFLGNIFVAERFVGGAPRKPEALHMVHVPDDAAFNVIFVHGVHGDHIATWSNNGGEDKYWPKWLAGSFPKAAVYSLQYSAYVTKWLGITMPMYDRSGNLLDLLENESMFQRPTIFIAHSYGGLVVKQLWRTVHDRDLGHVRESVRGVIFLATPHSGSHLGKFILFLLPRILSRPSPTAEELQHGEVSLRELNTWYRNHPIARNFVFYETLDTPPVGRVVDEVSADPGIPGVYPVAISANHITICKPLRSDQVVRSVDRYVREIVEAAAQAAKRNLPAAVDATQQSMMIQIESGNAEVVEALIESGVQVDLVIDGRSPLRAALDGVERNRSDAAIAVLGVLLRAGPRELAAEVQRVVRNRGWHAMMSLRQAGLGSDLRVGDGVPLAVALLRQMPDASWMERFVAAGPALDGDSAAFLLPWSCRYGDFGLAKAALSRAGADARVDAGPPDWEIEDNERIVWSPGGTALHMLAASRHQASPVTIDSLLERNAPAAAIDQDGNTALVIASAGRKVEFAKQLVAKMDAGAIAICNRDGRSAIEMAVGTPAIVAALLARLGPAAATHCVDALHRAGYEHDEDSARMLLDAGVGVDERRDGVTALLDLSRFWYSHMSYEMRPGAGMRCLQLLVDRGASVGARDTDGRTALHWLAQFGDREAVELLLRSGAELNAADARGCTPLMYAAGNAASDVLVGAGARAEHRDRNGYSAEDWAVMSGAREDGSARARLVRAVRQGDVQAAVTLLDETPANACEAWGNPLLHVAARRWDHEVCAVLLTAGSGVDQRDPECRTALYEALTASPNGMSLERLRTTVKLLLQNGSAVEDVNGRGDPASHVGSCWWFDPVFARDLLKRCRGMVNASGETVLMRAIESGSADQVHDVVAAGCEIDARDARGPSALFRFSPRKDGSKNTRVLLEAGANANLADHEEVTPLMQAARRDDLPALELLMQYGADPGQRNAAGNTAGGIATVSGSRLAMNWLWLPAARSPLAAENRSDTAGHIEVRLVSGEDQHDRAADQDSVIVCFETERDLAADAESRIVDEGDGLAFAWRARGFREADPRPSRGHCVRAARRVPAGATSGGMGWPLYGKPRRSKMMPAASCSFSKMPRVRAFEALEVDIANPGIEEAHRVAGAVRRNSFRRAIAGRDQGLQSTTNCNS